MLKLVLALLVIVLLSGCARPFSPPAECANNEKSYILGYLDNPTGLDTALLIVNIAALEAVPGYSIEDANAVLDEAEALLYAAGTDYATLVAYILQKTEAANARAGLAVFTAAGGLSQLAIPTPLTPCDIALIRIHLQRQRAILLLYSAGK